MDLRYRIVAFVLLPAAAYPLADAAIKKICGYTCSDRRKKRQYLLHIKLHHLSAEGMGCRQHKNYSTFCNILSS